MAMKPPMLRRGDSVGIVTPGSPLDASIIDARIRFLENMGYPVVIGKYAYYYGGITAATAQRRAEDLMSMFSNRRVRMILPTRGGTGVKDIFPYLDLNVIRNNPKIVTGYSDITILLNMLYQLTELITFQSLMLIDFNAATPAYNFNQFFAAVSTPAGPRVIQSPTGAHTVSLVQGNVTGPVVGGNLTSLVTALGTPYEIDTAGKILVIEETHEPSNVIYRYLTQLIMAGKFRDCLGIVMGECTNCTISYNTSYQDLIQSLIVPLGKPLMTGFSTAHGIYKAAIPIGAMVNLDTYRNTFTVLESAVSP
ncbi:LD-carboxypeptidase [Paenibacillus sp. P26]|nr:LD-carboxypeptidase [Paenibacillus sp. P26]UUZ90968.1 LD-carboxypeptidase [Paenibacillus sp. P25]